MELRIGLSYSSTRKHRLSYLGSLKPPADSNRWLGTPSKALHPNTPIIISNSDRHFSSRGVMLQNWRSFCTWSNCLIVSISPLKKLPVMPTPPSKCIKQRLVHCIYLCGNFVSVGMVWCPKDIPYKPCIQLLGWFMFTQWFIFDPDPSAALTVKKTLLI